MPLFDYPFATNSNPAKHVENRYNYLQYSNKLSAKRIKEQLECWFKEYPEEEKHEIKRRMKKEEHFDGALFEMYLYSMFHEMGYEVGFHPKMENSSHRPDFLLKREDREIILEATVDKTLSDEEKKTKNRREAVLDAINNIKCGHYRIELTKLEITNEKQPSLKSLKRYLNEKINELSVSSFGTYETFSEEFQYSDSNINMKCRVFLVSADHKDSRFIQRDTSNPAVWMDTESLRNSLDKKSQRYGELKKPYIIAVNSLDMFLDEEDIRSVLLGDRVEHVYMGKNSSISGYSTEYKDNGFFSEINSRRNDHVSGVLIYKLSMGNLMSSPYYFIRNPNAKYPLIQDDFSLDYIIPEDNIFRHIKV